MILKAAPGSATNPEESEELEEESECSLCISVGMLAMKEGEQPHNPETLR